MIMSARAASSLEYDYLFKIVLVGDAAVGKTNLLACYTSQVLVLKILALRKSFGPLNHTLTHPRVEANTSHLAGGHIYRLVNPYSSFDQYQCCEVCLIFVDFLQIYLAGGCN